ncbi:UbiA prenyltransferase family-domain-containing protein [Nemania sp. FL0916]|nr:UbiA prenyltransferase family-domain-containing protein [Nemania sp. FL0916]
MNGQVFQRRTGTDSLSQQYGGIHARGWVDRLPASWIPYVQLSRLSPPAGLLLIYFPHLFGVIHTTSVHERHLSHVAYVSFILLGGSFFCNNASHAWNDFVDAFIDTLVARTKTRPIPRGAITRRAAFLDTAIITVPNIIVTTYYLYAKRHTHLLQMVLGFSLGADAPWRDHAIMCLFIASISWVVIFDTIYAYQDVDDDLRYGIKSMAVLLQGRAKPLLFSLCLFMCLFLITSGYLAKMGFLYYLVTVGVSTWFVVFMVVKVDLHDLASCWHWFSRGFLLTGFAIAIGLLIECVGQVDPTIY